MPHRHLIELPRDRLAWLFQTAVRLTGTYGIVQGVGIVLGGAIRWDGNPALAAALSVPGAPPSWGLFIAIFGVLAVVGTFRSAALVRIGCFGIAVWAGSLTIALAKNVIESDRASTTGPPNYLWQAGIVALLALAYLPRADHADS